jgi:hypothetical protein
MHMKRADGLSRACVRFAAKKFARAGAARKNSVVDKDAITSENGLRHAFYIYPNVESWTRLWYVFRCLRVLQGLRYHL